MAEPEKPNQFPISAGILLGLGLGGFFDGIVLHQILQWHHMATSAGYPANTVDNLELNTLLDGLFHAATWLFTLAGLFILWRKARHTHVNWNEKYLCGSFLIGFGLFNLVEGIIDHHILGLHHVNETVPRDQWIYWDSGFLVWGALMLIVGWWMLKRARRAPAGEPNAEEPPRPAGPVHAASRRG
ncbi:DUF2243 domain-containing protein [Dongia deserti]|uniref:DUF2243 domain-containing protein n=1 Tax=Dongia deserti TaxID=2268030 RepID=UPI000E65008B|nr:DUF2243 domain-containing protein [Dongia deserti]